MYDNSYAIIKVRHVDFNRVGGGGGGRGGEKKICFFLKKKKKKKRFSLEIRTKKGIG